MDKNNKKSINLLNVENYNKELDKELYYKGLSLYISIGNQCIKYLLKNLKTTNKEYIIFIIERGIKTITHVYNFLIMYTKNINLLEHHLEKAYLYYVEFVSQIGEESNTYIKLNSKDATLFVYKKTIYDINNDYRHKFKLVNTDVIFLNKMNSFMEIYNNILINITNLIIKENKIEIIADEYKKRNKDFEKIIKNTYSLFSKYDYMNLKHLINDMIYELLNKNVKIDKFMKILILLTNKYKKKELDYNKVKRKLHSDTNENITYMTPLKYVNWLYN
tara:strand:- start:7247 stop:8074 length:828 start_codon:yes stop_codon:yes gene_type:complete